MSEKNATEFPSSGRLAGIDFGTVRIGVAICDPSQSIASPYENYNTKGRDRDVDYFKKLVRDESIVGWVVGLPIHLSGDESEKSNQAREFAKWLHTITGLPYRLYDERFTTSLAEQILGAAQLTKKKRKQRLDQLAAQILLTAFLESSRNDTQNDSLG